MLQRLFVYGTLALGKSNQHILSEIGGRWVKASVRGRLQDAGWGAQMGYPAIVLDESAEAVSGYLFASENLRENWEKLDAFEGEEYERVTARVQLSDNTTVEAFVYVLRDQGPL